MSFPNSDAQRIGARLVQRFMMTNRALQGKGSGGDYVVRSPRPTDAVGHALRGAFGEPTMPEEFLRLLRRLDQTAH